MKLFIVFLLALTNSFFSTCQHESDGSSTCGCDTSIGEICRRLERLERQIENCAGSDTQSSTVTVGKTCQRVKQENPDVQQDGSYTLVDESGTEYDGYCDMTTDGGGWTLVASIHDNDVSGRCTAGDKWSSERGNNPQNAHGDGSWANNITFGSVETATTRDYKSPAYFQVEAKNIMIWQVPNQVSSRTYSSSAYFKYRTTDGFLSQYGGNLRSLFADHFPLTSGVYSYPSDSGPSVPVVFDVGLSSEVLSHFPPNIQSSLEPGYIQFRAISTFLDAYALCPGVRNKPTSRYPSYACLGSTGWNRYENYCGDFSGFKYPSSAPGTGWSADERLLSTTFLIFYR
ncbi:unnamed protein product [Clavelina lepadiformis]|uniref:Fibrinogen C-terminal domain-containing protein n=1 Tax=Clavelina lepadiformis TaxID=159417 RepID=A0ABP0H423_CLALP